MIEQLHPQIARDAVADGGGQPRLRDAEHRRQQEQPDHGGHEADEQTEVGRAAGGREQRVVEDALHDQRRDHPDGRAGDDEDAGDDDPAEVRPEQGHDARAEVGDLGRLRVEPALGRLVDAAEGRATAAGGTAAPSAHCHDRQPTTGCRQRGPVASRAPQPSPATRLMTVARMTAPNR